MLMLSHSVLSNSATLWTVAHQAPLSMGFSRQEYWSLLISWLQSPSAVVLEPGKRKSVTASALSSSVLEFKSCLKCLCSFGLLCGTVPSSVQASLYLLGVYDEWRRLMSVR